MPSHSTRYPWPPLEELLRRMGCTTTVDMATALGLAPHSRRNVYRWRTTGVDYWTADSLAVALGKMPWDIWPEWDDAPIPVAKARAAAVEAERLFDLIA